MQEHDYIFYSEEEDREKAERLIIQNMTKIMRKAEIPEMYIYPFQKTGLLVTTENRDEQPIEVQEAWDAAILEYQKSEQSRTDGEE